MMHTIRRSEDGLWTVGIMNEGVWWTMMDFNVMSEAAAYCSWLNGGLSPELDDKLTEALKIGGAFSR